jgi:uncharacterized protein (DUF3084 family)
VEELEG